MKESVSFNTEALLHDIRVEPAQVEREKLPEGGPVWPEDNPYIFIRNLRSSKPAGSAPKPGSQSPEIITTPSVWCGYAVRHFGHFIAEQAPRLLAALLMRPDDYYIFLAPPKITAETLPSWFWDVLDWYGLPRSQVVIVTDKPVLIRTLRVFPQAEHLVVGPETAYLKALDRSCSSRLAVKSGDLAQVYISRAGMGSGRLGGEEYLEQQLIAAGVTVVRPETLPLKEQLSYYARARSLIFAEGSAAHGRQLLGRIDQKISIVSRRKGWAFAAPLLRPRARQLNYLDTLHGSIHFSLDPLNGQPKRWEAFAFVNGKQLVKRFEALGIPLRDSWDMATFEAAQTADMVTWAKIVSQASQPHHLEQRIRLLQGAFLAIGQENRAHPLIKIARDVAAGQASGAR